MQECIVFSKEKKTYRFSINPEKPYFRIVKIYINSNNDRPPLVPNFKLKYTITGPKETTTNYINYQSNQIVDPKKNYALFQLDNTVVNGEGCDSILFEFSNDDHIDPEVFFYYTTQDLSVDLQNPFKDFSQHISSRSNSKILFSGPFGQGKTTFLNHYFDSRKDLFEVFKLYPVNYAVSHNDDIFKYIKSEILFQLMGKDVDFEKQDFSFIDTAPEFFKNNLHRIISPFLTLLPKIGKSASDIYEKLFKLCEEYLNYHNNIQLDDRAKALVFIKELYEKEGSVFEDNFYTQLIRELLGQHKLKSGKENVLIIDDVDRMDPDHIFRIFNVFSANFDSQHFADGLTNKFGFDKIILVCDYTNIKRLFIHRYGDSYSFEGYLSKYYSKAPFNYDNKKAMQFVVSQFRTIEGKRWDNDLMRNLIIILNDLIDSDELTLRELLNLLSFQLLDSINERISIRSENIPQHYKLIYFSIIHYLMKIFNAETLVEKLGRCKNFITSFKQTKYADLIAYAFVPLVEGPVEGGSYVFSFQEIKVSIEVTAKYDNILKMDFYSCTKINHSSEIGMSDKIFFYELLLLNVEKFRTISILE